jgi:hypothetical protein
MRTNAAGKAGFAGFSSKETGQNTVVKHTVDRANSDGLESNHAIMALIFSCV